ncbi:hypothetical protein [Pseudoduganella namucuonensis]|uniref:Uncharacterized protein n=1 Tax=Pseudoduganella namucuonensis TaxID=1035707 RepID=A0A1I7K9K2_9BURK|nr:hypothetical protein [Pseudoduganella namucuonensis]SFU94114.1 hypothetical protein SAMN05216552_1015146 [Pseudoduganella namucuonensis]
MATSTPQRHQLIAKAVLRQPDDVAGTSALLWQRLASRLSPVIGEGGFMALYLRSLHVARSEHGWLPLHDALPCGAAFTELEQALRRCDPAQAAPASTALLCGFLDTLILLIGELLTTSILREAWGDDVENHAGTELPK